jgi:hypothetical protein
MPPTSLVVDSPCDRLQTAASRIYGLPLPLREKERPCVDPVRSLVALSVLLKTKSFLQFHKVQSKAHTPTRIRALSSLTIALNQLPNKSVILFSGGNL